MSTMDSLQDLDSAIATEEERLAELDQLRGAAVQRLVELRAARPRAAAEADTRSLDGEWSPERKLALFASLFRGRGDVFPVRWENRTKGKSLEFRDS
jgi:hypothetical protein